MKTKLACVATAAVFLMAACGGGSDSSTPSNQNTSPNLVAASTSQTAPVPQMQAVLNALEALGVQPVQTLTVEQARAQPTPADAVKAVLQSQGASTAPQPVNSVVDSTFPGPAGPVGITIYTPAGKGPFPVILYIHGGGFVIANRQVYDSSARALTNLTNAIVVSTDYRQGPENRFPAAHDDTYAAYLWVRANAASFNGDASRVAVAGESAGANMAASIAIRARDAGIATPTYQLLVYPITNYAFDTPSQQVNMDTAPLSTKNLIWYYGNYLNSAADGANPEFSVLRANLKGLPPATVITADDDPLRSEGANFAAALISAGVTVDFRNYPGVTHEFFSMGAVLDEAKQANQQAADDLKKAFGTQ
jgi:acetyl esterase